MAEPSTPITSSEPQAGPRAVHHLEFKAALLLLFTVRTPPSGSAAMTADAISEPRTIARVFIVVCSGVPDDAGLESAPNQLPSDFGLAAFDSDFGAGVVSDFGAGLLSPLAGVAAGGDSFLAACL